VVGLREYHFGDYRTLELPFSLIVRRDRGSSKGGKSAAGSGRWN
jgi:hypothetical protein